jgi:hypothetical protein
VLLVCQLFLYPQLGLLSREGRERRLKVVFTGDCGHDALSDALAFKELGEQVEAVELLHWHGVQFCGHGAADVFAEIGAADGRVVCKLEVGLAEEF